jgi:Swiss Army Knife RNA repair-like protein
MEPPVWMLDIDGVINANKPGWGEAPRRRIIGGFIIRWAPKLIVRMKELQAAHQVEIRWSTTWCGSPWELGMLAMTVGLECAPAFAERPPHKTWGDMKAEAALDVLASGRRLVWTDDDEVGGARWLFPQFEEAEEDGRALLIAPRSNRGLQPDHLDAIEAFATQHNGTEA